MLDVAVQLLAAFAANSDHGVNEMAQTIPRGGFNGADPDPAPPVITIVSDVNDPGVAAGLDPREVPCFMMWGDSSTDITLQGYKLAREVIIAGAFVTDNDADPFAMSRACGYILRGGLLTFARYNDQRKSTGYRQLNGVKVLEIRNVTEQRMTQAVGRRKMWGFLDIRAIVVETLQ